MLVYDSFVMDKIVHQEIYKKRMLFVKQIQYGRMKPYYAGYMEIIPSDPPIFRKKVAANDYEFFDHLELLNWGLDRCTFAGKQPYFKDHPMYIGFDTQEVYYPISKLDCIDSLRNMADFLDKRLNHEDKENTEV